MKVYFFLRRHFLKVFFIFLIFPSFSERYQISDVTYSLEKTRENDLKRVVPIDTERIFESEEEFDEYLSDLKQRLLNTRAFDEVEVISNKEQETRDREQETGEKAKGISDRGQVLKENSEGENLFPITYSLLLNCHDTKSLLILPYPKYDSNDGLIFKVKVC